MTIERNIGFKEDAFDVLLKYENWHWWFQSRNRLIVDLIRKFGSSTNRILEIGCGNGLVTDAIYNAFPESEIVGTEFLEAGLVNARERLPNVTFQQLDARDLEGNQRFDIVCAFDVLEHIDADLEVMKSIRTTLRDERSRFFITVPQHMALWSEADVYAKHERRYSYSEMQQKLCIAGFEVEYRTSFVFLLSPLMYLSRSRKQGSQNYDPEDEFKISNTANSVISSLMKLEAFLRRIGTPMPFGGSLVVVAKPK